MIDFSMSGGGTVYLLHANTPKAQELVYDCWLDRDVIAGCVVINHRYAKDTAGGLLSDGFTVELNGRELKLGV